MVAPNGKNMCYGNVFGHGRKNERKERLYRLRENRLLLLYGEMEILWPIAYTKFICPFSFQEKTYARGLIGDPLQCIGHVPPQLSLYLIIRRINTLQSLYHDGVEVIFHSSLPTALTRLSRICSNDIVLFSCPVATFNIG